MASTSIISGSFGLQHARRIPDKPGICIYDVAIPLGPDLDDGDLNGTLHLYVGQGDAEPASDVYLVRANVCCLPPPPIPSPAGDPVVEMQLFEVPSIYSTPIYTVSLLLPLETR